MISIWYYKISIHYQTSQLDAPNIQFIHTASLFASSQLGLNLKFSCKYFNIDDSPFKGHPGRFYSTSRPSSLLCISLACMQAYYPPGRAELEHVQIPLSSRPMPVLMDPGVPNDYYIVESAEWDAKLQSHSHTEPLHRHSWCWSSSGRMGGGRKIHLLLIWLRETTYFLIWKITWIK